MKDTKNILILGGYGRVGLEMAKLLLRHSRHNICLAGRDLTKASRAARELNSIHFGERVSGVEVNAALKKQLTGLLTNYDLVIVYIPFTAFGGQIAQAAFDARIDYIDLTTNDKKRQRLRELDKSILEAGLTFITEAGFVPGAPSLMARYVAAHFDSVTDITIGGLFKEEKMSYRSLIDLIPALGDNPETFHGGSWQKAGLTMSRKIDFDKKHGIRQCYPMDLAELRDLPDKLGCRELGFYSSGVNWFVDLTVLTWKALRLYKPRWGVELGARLITWGSDKFTRPSFTCSVNVTVNGIINGRSEKLKLTLQHKDPYRAAAIATVPGVMGLLDGSIKQPGVHMMGHLLDPERYMENLWDMEMKVSLQGLPDTWHEEYRANEIRLVDQVA